MLDEHNLLPTYLVPGSFIQFKGNANNFIVEKVYDNQILLSAYHHSNIKNNKIANPNLQYVTAEKFFLTREDLDNQVIKDPKTGGLNSVGSKVQIVNIYLPK
jgi:hypothetical protein